MKLRDTKIVGFRKATEDFLLQKDLFACGLQPLKSTLHMKDGIDTHGTANTQEGKTEEELC